MSYEPVLVLATGTFLTPQSYTIEDGRISSQGAFTRASSATYFNSSGVMVTVLTGIRRFHYMQDGSGYSGVLVEGSATNVCLQSEDISTTWTNTNSSDSTNVTQAINNEFTADEIIVDTAAGLHNIEQTFTGSTSNDFTASLFAKQGTHTDLHLRVSDTADTDYIDMIVDLSDGSIVQAAAATGGNATLTDSGVESLNNGWYRVWISGICDSTTTAHKLVVGIAQSTTLSYTGNGTDSIFVWGMQLEQASIPSSYIATTTTSVTRQADVISLDLSAYSWFNNTEGTIYIDFKRYGEVTGTRTVAIQLDDGAASESININQSATSKQLAVDVTDGAVAQVATAISTGDSNIRCKVAFAYKANDFATSLNGAAAVTDTSGTVPTGIVTMRMGADDSGNYLNGVIGEIRYYNTRLSDANLATITT